jgi:DNA-directed RNA polymerase sigma subunit (sigma70/sigma32)
MKITAITKFKHGGLFEALKQLNWSQNELSRRSGIHNGTIGRVINMKERPSERVANKIQETLGEAGVYLDVTQEWPETFKGFDKTIKIEQTKDISILELEAAHTFYNQLFLEQLPEEADYIDGAIMSLTNQEKEVIESRFGFNGFPKSLDEVGSHIGHSRENTRQIQNRAIRKIKRKIEANKALDEINI